MTKTEIFKAKFPEFKGIVDACKFDTYGNTKEIIDFIDVPNNEVKYTYFFLEECGCCYGRDEDTETLDFMLDDMSDDEFDGLCEDAANQL